MNRNQEEDACSGWMRWLRVIMILVGMVGFAGSAASQSVVVDCPLEWDLPMWASLNRGFYVESYPGGTLTQVDLWFNSWEYCPCQWEVSLSARAGTYDGQLIGQDLPRHDSVEPV